MPDRKSLLIIDRALFNDKFQEYFAQFGFEIIQKSKFSQIDNNVESLTAILINWSIIQADPTIIENIYQHYSIPIIIISDANNEDICVRMLEAGADDFLVKPINPRELHARIGSITRRVQHINQPTDNKEKEIISFADWHLYTTSRQLFKGNNEQPLSTKEYDLLLAFVRRPQQILDRDFLLHVTHCSAKDHVDRRIDVQISRLRQKIEADVNNPVLIKTIRNNGYIFTAPVLLIKE